MSFREIIEPILAQQLIQPAIERVTRGGRKSMVVTHIAGCRLHLRLPIAMRTV